MFARQGQLIFKSQNSVLAASVGGLVLVDNLKNTGRGIQPKLPLSLWSNLTGLFLWPALA